MNRRRIPGLLLALALASAGPAAAKCQFMKLAELPITMSGSRPVVTVMVDGAEARLVADSGAFFSVLTPAAAARLGIKTRMAPGFEVRGAGGSERVAIGTVKDFAFAGLKLGKADFLVTGRNVGTDIDGFLGQNMLGGVEIEYDLANGMLRLFKAKDCPTQVLAYWATKAAPGIMPISRVTPLDRHIMGSGKVNGQPIRVMFDTGAGRSILRRQAAERAGIRRDGPDVVSGGLSWGFGSRLIDTWIAPVDSFELADEKIQHTRLRIADIELADADMLLGADFFLSHRVLISSTQHRLYFTYNGGPVFHLNRENEAEGGDDGTSAAAGPAPSLTAPKPPVPVAAAAAKAETTTLDAAGYSRRASASLARNDRVGAIADYNKAIELEPKEARHRYDRALARVRNRQPALALEDLDQALKLKPDDVDALLFRGQLLMTQGNRVQAELDLAAASRLGAKDGVVRLQIGQIYSGAGMQEAALPEIDAALALLPRVGLITMSALNAACWSRTLLNRDLEKALAYCNAAVKLGPNVAQVLDSRGLVHLRLGQNDAAIDDYDDALRRRPKTAWSLYGRGLAKQRKGLKAEGDADIAAALALDAKLAAEVKRYGIAP
jgi:tetratricopeptide (TPR) repeat protein/predicted aspartyl protease